MSEQPDQPVQQPPTPPEEQPTNPPPDEQPDQNQPAPGPPNYDEMLDRANPKAWPHLQPRQNQRPDTPGPKGAELDAALTEAGLPHTGTADEKRERLAEHQAE